ncbi:peroxisome proliferator-activated receptor gamma coactivator-related protein 1 isoform X2 [Sphaeramia orbicularis]|uniref:peroxisome proliferator-activated receptor gamma coactivator-related protein 1 isoform X2 n=1 Tax=Sphaeramia orbicularis TaxID=375764 RepID=UPI00117CC8A8|nr:peroxisome proliferator-activated receptor gamma coactivator-related protein 1-like isoform X2 [Sphaeramia orbicularis]
MWRSKMAARWRRKDGNLNAGISDFFSGNNPNEFLLNRGEGKPVEMDSESCVDHSILAIFEDAAVSSEGKSRVEEENENLLSALTEMLENVEDDDGTLSPFDTLPESTLLTHQEHKDNSVEMSLADRLRQQLKTPNLPLTLKGDGVKDNESNKERDVLLQQQNRTLFQSKNNKAEAEVEVFTTASLVNLVRIMHPYCLKLRVEEEGKDHKSTTRPTASSLDNTLFSKEEVWKYERPAEDIDEEINVVSDDDDGPVEEKRVGDEKGDGSKTLKSALLNGNPSRNQPLREKKRVSFGPVQVASFDESIEQNEKNLTSGVAISPPQKPLGNPTGSVLEAQTPPSENRSRSSEGQPQKSETKAKSLSLQQYRQLRQKRQPLVEKQGNYTTKWPSVSEPPKELTPILCLQGQNKTTLFYPTDTKCGTASEKSSASSALHPESKPYNRMHHKGKPQRSKVRSPPEHQKSPVKTQTLLSSDPPNPVLVPLPATQPSKDICGPQLSTAQVSLETEVEEVNSLKSTRLLQTPAAEPELTVLLFNPDCNLTGTDLPQEESSDRTSRSPGLCSTMTHQAPSECIIPSPQKCSPSSAQQSMLVPSIPESPSPTRVTQVQCPSSYQPLTPVATPVKETLPEVVSRICPPEAPPPSLQLDYKVQRIEATDLTSLLEQFEETQAKEEGECEKELQIKPEHMAGPVTAAPPPNTLKVTDVHRSQCVVSSRLLQTPSAEVHISTSESAATPKTLSSRPNFQTADDVEIPEALGTEIILTTRRKVTPSKSIQIIDPRPLPSKKTHPSLPESSATYMSAHIFASISSDHDYCSSLTPATERSRAWKLKDISETSDEMQVNTCDSSIAVAAAVCKGQTPPGDPHTPFRTENESVRLDHKTTSDMDRSSELLFSDQAVTGENCSSSEAGTELSIPPTPPPSPPCRGRGRDRRRRYRRRSPRSDSSSSSHSSTSSSSSSNTSCSPKRQKLHHKYSDSSSCSSSPSCSVSRSPSPLGHQMSYSRPRFSRSRSRSWSRSRSRSPCPRNYQRRWRDVSRESRKLRREHEIRIQKLRAIDERRVVYVGRIRRSMTHNELRERFSQFGDVECVSLHFRDRGDHYGFVTFYNMEDAFAAIDNGGKLRRPDELPFDICFGGRRQFCNSDYADLDANRDAHLSPVRTRFEEDDFDSLLKQAQRGIRR